MAADVDGLVWRLGFKGAGRMCVVECPGWGEVSSAEDGTDDALRTLSLGQHIGCCTALHPAHAELYTPLLNDSASQALACHWTACLQPALQQAARSGGLAPHPVQAGADQMVIIH